MIAQSNVTHMVVGKDDNVATTSETRDSLIAGQIGIFKVGVVTANGASALTAGDRFTIVYKRNDGALIESPVISYSNISNKKAESTAATSTQRVRCLGFNGTSGAIDASNNEDYVVHYNWYDNSKTMGLGKPVKFLAYKSDAAATQVEIADGLMTNAITNNSRETTPVILPAVLINSAGTANAATSGADFTHLKFTKGSKYVVGTNGSGVEMLGTDELIDTIVAGDYLRAGTAVTDVCYKMDAVTAGTATTALIITLVNPYQGTTTEIAVGSTEYIAAATAASADAGLQLTGQVLPFAVGLKKYDVVDFDFWKVGEGFGSTKVSSTSTPSKGKGTYKEIAEIEWSLRGNRGEAYRTADYPVNYTADATSGKTYQQITFNYFDDNARILDRSVNSYGSIFIATETESSSTVHTNLKTVFGIS